MSPTVLSTKIPGLSKFITGKVRDVYDLGHSLLLVATDRISAFDVVLPNGIPDKGRVLTQLSRFWFEKTSGLLPNHYIASDMDTIGQSLREAGATITPDLVAQLSGRSLLVQKCDAIPLECVVRGYLAGSAWKDYRTLFSHGGEVTLYGIPVPVGLREADPFSSPLFTPATKAQSGHDENISLAQAASDIGAERVHELAEKSLSIYNLALEHAASKGLILADTKFEFGVRHGKIILIDEALTPDSSRYWDAAGYKPGRAQPSFDKQFVRDYLETLDWDKNYPGPDLPIDVIEKTSEKYRDAYRRLVGTDLPME